MAAITLVFGSVLGFFGAILGWVAFDISFTTAASIYIGTSLGLTAMAMLTKAANCAMSQTSAA